MAVYKNNTFSRRWPPSPTPSKLSAEGAEESSQYVRDEETPRRDAAALPALNPTATKEFETLAGFLPAHTDREQRFAKLRQLNDEKTK
jgi:hypothetical protein